MGRLQYHQAQGLVEGVAELRLVNLEIHSSPSVSDEGSRNEATGDNTYNSPLIFFFYTLLHCYGPSLLSGTLLSTLETHILRDHFHVLRNARRQCISAPSAGITSPCVESSQVIPLANKHATSS